MTNPTTTVLLAVHGEQHVTLDSEAFNAALTAGPAALDDLLEGHFDGLDIRSAIVLPSGDTIPLAPEPLPGPDIRALAIDVHRDAVDSGSQAVLGSAEKLLLALGVDPTQVPPF
ncbi:hypothetical protein ABTX81_30380 [Kitasatospora sp. NPDC097605]|uniref:hypothetical protein n=1 Tax=Kitasatospora sp. NPDC097605 TaxID=3157226 RepID=UPI00331C27CE